MKNKIWKIASLIFVVLFFCQPVSAREIPPLSICEPHGKCDADDNGLINRDDYDHIRKYVVMIVTTCGHEGQTTYCDISNDGRVSSLDALFLIRMMMNVPETLTVEMVGQGSVAQDPNKETYYYSETVSLTATPTAGYTFSHWSGDATGSDNPVSITMDNNKTVTANFIASQYPLTVNVSGQGTVSKNPDQATYAPGEAVALNASPAAGWSFTNWSGDASGNTNPLTINMDGAKTITADFSPESQAIIPVATPASGSYTTAQNVSLSTATPGAEIYYTLDGQTPTTNSVHYTGPIVIAQSVVLKAIAVAAGMLNSPVMAESYVLNSTSYLHTIYIDPTYNGQNGQSNGTIERPYRDLSFLPGVSGGVRPNSDTQYLFKSGTTFDMTNFHISHAGSGATLLQNIKFGSYGEGTRPVLVSYKGSAGGGAPSSLISFGGTYNSNRSMENLTIENLELYYAGPAAPPVIIGFTGGGHIKNVLIQNSKIHDGDYGVRFWAFQLIDPHSSQNNGNGKVRYINYLNLDHTYQVGEYVKIANDLGTIGANFSDRFRVNGVWYDNPTPGLKRIIAVGPGWIDVDVPFVASCSYPTYIAVSSQDFRNDNIKILNNEIYNIGSDGILIPSTHNIEVGYNTMYMIGTNFYPGCPEDSCSSDVIQLINGNNHYVHDNSLDKSNAGNKFNIILSATTNPLPTGAIVERNTIKGPALTGSGGSAIYVGGHSDVIIRYNTFLAPHTAAVFYDSTDNTQVYGNSITGGTAGLILGGNNNSVYNNVFYENSALDIFNAMVATGGLVKNNIFYNLPGQVVYNHNYVDNMVASYNLFYTNEDTFGANKIIGDPLFVDAPAGNFQLQPASPARNAGTVIPGYSQDGVGHLVPNPSDGNLPDIGAYEYYGGTPYAAPAPSGSTTVAPRPNPEIASPTVSQNISSVDRQIIENFQKIFKKIPDTTNQADRSALSIMTQGISQEIKRNLNSEKAGLATFQAIYRKTPSSNQDWNLVKAIAYSGAVRDKDSDGDLLTDSREISLGTNPYKKDTDGDGYSDGVEVLNGYSPLDARPTKTQ